MLRALPLILALGLIACGSGSDDPVPAEETTESEAKKKDDKELALVPAGDLRADQAVIKFALYALPRGKGGLVAAAEQVLEREFRHINPVGSDGKNEPPSVMIVAPPMAEFAPPSVQDLQTVGRGIDERTAHELQASKEAVVLAYAGTKDQMPTLHRDALRMTAAVAAQTGSAIWDEDTGQLFSYEQWARRTMADPKLPASVGQHFAIRSVRKGPVVRQITHGMVKFGLPDILCEKVPVASAAPMATLINLVAAQFIADPFLETEGALFIDLEKLGLDRPPGAKKKVKLTLVRAERRKGDPENRILAIAFPGPPETLHERQVALLNEITGAEDEVSSSQLDAEVVEASLTARKRLAALRTHFQKGLREQEMLLVKAPFKTRDKGKEWMWVELQDWEGSKMGGILQNDPQYVDGLESGSRVVVDEQHVFDYIHKLPDGKIVGNETAKILERKRLQAEGSWNAGIPTKERKPKLGEKP